MRVWSTRAGLTYQFAADTYVQNIPSPFYGSPQFDIFAVCYYRHCFCFCFFSLSDWVSLGNDVCDSCAAWMNDYRAFCAPKSQLFFGERMISHRILFINCFYDNPRSIYGLYWSTFGNQKLKKRKNTVQSKNIISFFKRIDRRSINAQAQTWLDNIMKINVCICFVSRPAIFILFCLFFFFLLIQFLCLYYCHVLKICV